MTTKNKRSIPTTFSFRDVAVVVTAMLTALAPLFTSDYKINQLESQAHVLTQQLALTKSEVDNTRAQLSVLSDIVTKHHNSEITDHDVLIANRIVELQERVDQLSKQLTDSKTSKNEIIIHHQ